MNFKNVSKLFNEAKEQYSICNLPNVCERECCRCVSGKLLFMLMYLGLIHPNNPMPRRSREYT